MAEQDDEVFELRLRHGSSARSLLIRKDDNPTFSFSSDSDDDLALDEPDQPKSVSFPKDTRNSSTLLQSDPKYDTIQSNVSRESSAAMFGCYDMWVNGDIQFMVVGGTVDSKERKYVCITKEVDVDDVANFMAYRWKKRTPKIILSIVNNNKYFKPWKNETQIEDFQRGLIEAANLTEMWLLTDGLDSGISKYIGNAVGEEMARRTSIESDNLHIKNAWVEEKLSKLTVLGVVSKSEISYGSYLDGKHSDAKSIENVGQKPHIDRYELNPDHTHFVMVEDVTRQELLSMRYNLETRFTHPVGRARRYRRMPSSHTTIPGSEPDMNDILDKEYDESLTPVIGLFIQGGPSDIDHCIWLLKKRVPIILIKGAGLAADLVAFAYEESQERSDKDHYESFIKPELVKKVMLTFPQDFKNNELARNQCRDRILEIVEFAHQGEQCYLTIIDPNAGGDLSNLSKYILNALFRSQPRRGGPYLRDQIQRDLQLTLDWNRCDLAKSKIYQKYNRKIKVEDYIFHQALQRNNREEFVELFLEKGFQVHRFLNHKRLHHLFENCQDREFFVGVCMEGVLGKSVNINSVVTKSFVEDDMCDLNHLLFRCTRLQKLVSPYELSMNSLGDYISNKEVAERRALNALLFWATLTNRHKLAKVIWKRTEDPMTMAVIISMILNNLAKYWCKDIDIKRKIKVNADEFGKMAVELLDLCYNDSSVQAFNILNKALQDFNNRTIVEIAKLANNKFFLAHSCCQKWLGQRWCGQIQIRELDWGIKLPDWFKIYTSVFLVFPMFVWISFKTSESEHRGEENEEGEEDDEEANEDNFMLQSNNMTPKRKQKKTDEVRIKIQNLVDRGETKLPVYLQIFYLWSAPITKFWIHQLFYVLFLALFSVATLMPTCGNVFMNFAVFLWTLMIWFEITRMTWVKKWKYPEVPIFLASVEIGLILVFLLVYLIFRILPHFVDHIDYMTAKFLMSIGLLFFYYRTLAVFLPISRTLGPMLIAIKRMIRKDFLTWFRMFMIVMVSGGISIHASLYPNFPITVDALKKAFARAFFAMFLTKIDDLDGDPSCSYLYKNVSDEYCAAPSLTLADHGRLEECPYSSFGGYFIVTQYLLITKLILVTLLFAMFSATNAQVSKEALEIWKYQRYVLIIDFEERLRLPAPFTCISYFLMLLQFLFAQLRRLKHSISLCCAKCCRRSQDSTDGAKKIQIVKIRRGTDFNYWKRTLKLFITKENEKKNKEKQQDNLIESVNVLLDDMGNQKQQNKRMNDRLVTLERGVTSCCLMLEEIKHILNKKDSKTTVVSLRTLVHFSARQSPYPGTRIQRFPVFDKYVPWEVEYITYDPSLFTKLVKEFNQEIQMFVDPDILAIKKEKEERKKLKPDELEEIEEAPEFNPWWNSHCSVDVNGEHIEIDRCSYIHENDQPYRYKIDKSGLPKNPFGRTGMRGRGKLWRWGPNHRIAAVVTRWKRKTSNTGLRGEFLTIEDKRVLEFMVVRRIDTNEHTLPGGNVYGKITQYSVMCEEFIKDMIPDSKIDCGSGRLEEGDMIDFFAQFATSSQSAGRGSSNGDKSANVYTASVLYRGYIDDPSNTDNAWRESIVWNFHYSKSDIFDEKIADKENVWKEVSSYTHLYGNQDSIVKEAAKLHDAYF